MSIRRKQNKYIKGVSQSGPVVGVRLSKQGAEDLQFIIENFTKRYGPDLAPSVSSILDKAIITWAQSINFDEVRMANAHRELIEESSAASRAAA